jgi:hypothetical protein
LIAAYRFAEKSVATRIGIATKKAGLRKLPATATICHATIRRSRTLAKQKKTSKSIDTGEGTARNPGREATGSDVW